MGSEISSHDKSSAIRYLYFVTEQALSLLRRGLRFSYRALKAWAYGPGLGFLEVKLVKPEPQALPGRRLQGSGLAGLGRA